MSWAKVDDGFHAHPKVRRCSMAARGLWTTALSWSADNELDGFVPADMVPKLADGEPVDPLVAELLRVVAPYTQGLWETCDGGYRIHDYLDRNPSAASLTKARKATRKRVTRHRSRNAVTNAHVTDVYASTPGRDGTGVLVLSERKEKGAGKGKRANLPVPMPDDFVLTEARRQFALKGGLNPVAEWGHFVDHHRSKGSRFVDWDAAWRTWCRRAVTFPNRKEG